MAALEILVVLAVVAALRKNADADTPWSPERLTASPTATRLGIVNAIPPELEARARGLGIVAGALESQGFRITSAYRSRELSAAIHAENAERGLNLGYPGMPGPGDHDQARGLDVAPTPPSLDRATLESLRARALDSSVGELIRRALLEDDHVHLRFDDAGLDALGGEP